MKNSMRQLLIFNGFGKKFLSRVGVVPSTADVTSRWIRFNLATGTAVTCSAGAEYQTKIAGELSTWGSIERTLSGVVYVRIRGGASALYSTPLTYTLTTTVGAVVTNYDFVVTTMAEPVLEDLVMLDTLEMIDTLEMMEAV